MGKFYFSDLENQLLRNETKQKLVPSEFEHWGGRAIFVFLGQNPIWLVNQNAQI